MLHRNTVFRVIFWLRGKQIYHAVCFCWSRVAYKLERKGRIQKAVGMIDAARKGEMWGAVDTEKLRNTT